MTGQGARWSSQLVLGLGFGDEGKGLVTDYLVSHTQNPLVIRFSGGHQAGHTVVTDKVHHVFASFGSGTLRGAPTYWSPYCTVEPVALINELIVLTGKGISPVLYVDRRCPVTTPYDIASSRKFSAGEHGTVGVGFGATWAREEAHHSLLFEDLFHHSEVLRMKLDLIRGFYGGSRCPDEQLNVREFLDCCELVTESPAIRHVERMPKGHENIYEGSQGLLLDQSIGFFPHVTRSHTGSRNALALVHPDGYFRGVYLVTRAYQTRHGRGPMTNKDIHHLIAEDPQETNQYHPYQGEFRRSTLDVSLLNYAIDKDAYLRENRHLVRLVITCLDHLRDYAFTWEGKLIQCASREDFVLRVCDHLGVTQALMSSSPNSKNLMSLPRSREGVRA